MANFYRNRDFCPVWFDEEEFEVDKEKELWTAVQTELGPLGYSIKTPNSVCHQTKDFLRELCLSRYWLDQVSVVEAARAGRRWENGEWADPKLDVLNKVQIRSEKILTALETNEFQETLQEVQPRFIDYVALKEKLQLYLTTQDELTKALDPVLKEADETHTLNAIRKLNSLEFWDHQLKTEEALTATNSNKVIKSFQRSHNLEQTGRFNKATLKRVNQILGARIRKIQINLARMRQLPQELDDHLLVDIPSFTVFIRKENGDVKFQSKVVVGKQDWATPQFLERLSYIEVNPNWRVPDSITRQEIIPKILENENYLGEKQFQVMDKKTQKILVKEEVEEIDWEEYQEDDKPLPVRLVKASGPENPLGAIKFMFPNPHAVYLHSTSNQAVFERSQRAFSHGCIRVEKAAELAKAILSEFGKDYNSEEFEKKIGGNEPMIFKMRKELPVYFTYWTAKIEDGRVQFRDDIYQEDDSYSLEIGKPKLKVAE